MGCRNALQITLVLGNFVMFLVACVFNTLSALAESFDSGVFVSTTKNSSDTFLLEITPAGWTFSIWGFIYTFQAIWLLYSLSTLCIKTQEGHLYNEPALLPPALFIFYSLNLCCNISWLILFDRQYIDASLGVSAGMALTAYICIGVTMHSVSKHAWELISQGMGHHLYLTIAFVINGIATYAAWVTIATLLNLAMVLIYTVGLDNQIGSSIALGVLAFVLVFYVWLDMAVFERNFRYLYTPYMVLVFALAGSMDKNWDTTNPNTIFTVALEVCGGVLLMIKIIASIVQSCKHPLYTKSGESAVDKDYSNGISAYQSNSSSMALVHRQNEKL